MQRLSEKVMKLIMNSTILQSHVTISISIFPEHFWYSKQSKLHHTDMDHDNFTHVKGQADSRSDFDCFWQPPPPFLWKPFVLIYSFYAFMMKTNRFLFVFWGFGVVRIVTNNIRRDNQLIYFSFKVFVVVGNLILSSLIFFSWSSALTTIALYFVYYLGQSVPRAGKKVTFNQLCTSISCY